MIRLYGNLRDKFGPSIDCKVHSVPELMKACEAMRPGFRNHINKEGFYMIRRGDTFRKGITVPEEELEMRFGEDTWHIMAYPIGHGFFDGVVGIVVGVVLLVVSYYVPALAPYLVPIATSMILGGVANMLAPAPKSDYGDRESNKPSYVFNGPLNRVESGGAVPLIYGFNVFTGSIFTAGSIKTGDIGADSTLGSPK